VLTTLQLSHRPDDVGRMVFQAARDISADEELTVACFDLAQPKYLDVKERRKYLDWELRFTCACPRYIRESREQN
jgi:SET domain-containing protein